MSTRLLIAAGAAAESAERVPESVRRLIDSADEVLVIAPALPSRVHWLVSDTDQARSDADERLSAILGHLDELGQPAAGEVAADDPLLAFDDAINEFHPDHILIGLRGPSRSHWQERGLVEEILERFDLPATIFTI